MDATFNIKNNFNIIELKRSYLFFLNVSKFGRD